MNIRTVNFWTANVLQLATIVLLSTIGIAPISAADQWTNLNGTSTVTAEMLGMWNGRVLLKLENGRRVSVKKEDLRAESRIQAEARFEELQQRLRQRTDEIKMIAEEASAPAPKEILSGEATGLAAVPDSPQYDPVAEGADLRQTLVGIRDQVLAGHLRVLYDTLPASHQKAADELFATMLAKVDAQSIDASRQTLHGVGELILTRQRWLFSHPRMALMNDSQQAELLSSAAFLRVMFSDEVLSIETMRGRSLGETLAKIDEIIAPYLYASLNNPTTGISSMQPDFEVSPAADGKMVAKIVLPLLGPIATQTFVSLEGRWAWGETANAFQEAVQEAKKSLEQVPDNSVSLPPAAQTELAKVDQALNALMQAKTRQEFHRVLDGILPVIAKLVNDWSGYQPPAMPGIAGTMGGAGGYGAEGGYSGEPGYAEMMNSGGSDMSGVNPAGMGIAMPGSPGSAGSPSLAPTGSSSGPGMPGAAAPPALQLPGQP